VVVQPYLDSDMQSRWFDFGGNTIVRADQYVSNRQEILVGQRLTEYSQIHSTDLGSTFTIRMDILQGAAYCY
jgi:hypothetical protein